MYKTPAIGTIFPAAENTGIPNPGPTDNAADFNRWNQAQAQDQAFRQNELATHDYLNHFNESWLPNYQSGRLKGPTGIVGDPEAAPPAPPAAYVVIVRESPAGSQGIYFDVLMSGQDASDDAPATGPSVPVCAIPDYQKIAPPSRQGKIRS